MKKSLLLMVAGAAVALVGFFVGSQGSSVPSSSPAPSSLGGTINNVRNFFTGGLNVNALGGDVETIASGSVTFTAKQICGDSVIIQSGVSGNPAALASAQTNTFPSASSLIGNCLQSKGDARTIRFENNALIGFGRFVYNFQLGSGLDLFVASTSAAGPGSQKLKLAPENAAVVRFTNMNGASVSVDFLKMVNGD